MTLDVNQRNVKQRVSVAPSPATSGTDFSIDHATTYFFNSFEQTVPFKVTVYPMNELPTKQNSEVILVQAYSTSTRTGTITVSEVLAGHSAPGQVNVVETQPGDSTIPQSEVQTITVTATSGTYTLSFGGSTTAAINYNDTAATVQTRLQALTSIGAGNATVSGSAGGPYAVTFAGTLANSPQALITADPTNLVYGGAGTVAVAETTHGGVGVDEAQTVTVTGTGGSFTLSFGGQTTANLSWNISPASLQTELQALSSIGSGNCAVSGSPGSYTVEFTGTLGGAAQALMTADATLLVLAGQNEIETVAMDADGGTFRLSADGGANYTAALAYNASAATVQTAVTGLAAVGANNAVVTYNSSAGVYTVTFVGGKAATSMSLTADASSLTVSTAHITSCTRAQDNTTARTIVVGDHVEVTTLPDATTIAVSITSDQNNWAPAGYTSAALVVVNTSGPANINLTGFAGGAAGRRVTFNVNPNIGSTLTFKHQSASSTATNRFNVLGSTDGVINTLGGSFTFEYDAVNGWWQEIERNTVASDANYGSVLLSPGTGILAADYSTTVDVRSGDTTGSATATWTPDFSGGMYHRYHATSGGPGTLTIAATSNAPSGQSGLLALSINNASGGNLTASWDASYSFGSFSNSGPPNGNTKHWLFLYGPYSNTWICMGVH